MNSLATRGLPLCVTALGLGAGVVLAEVSYETTQQVLTNLTDVVARAKATENGYRTFFIRATSFAVGVGTIIATAVLVHRIFDSFSALKTLAASSKATAGALEGISQSIQGGVSAYQAEIMDNNAMWEALGTQAAPSVAAVSNYFVELLSTLKALVPQQVVTP